MRKYMFGINVIHLYYVTELMRKIVGPIAISTRAHSFTSTNIIVQYLHGQRVAMKQIVVALYSRGVTRSIYILCHRGNNPCICIVLYDLRGMCTSFYIKYCQVILTRKLRHPDPKYSLGSWIELCWPTQGRWRSHKVWLCEKCE